MVIRLFNLNSFIAVITILITSSNYLAAVGSPFPEKAMSFKRVSGGAWLPKKLFWVISWSQKKSSSFSNLVSIDSGFPRVKLGISQ